jgi:sporulation protein YlmC with PRC-barrel domain
MYAAMSLLDRQLVDRRGRFVGKVDDLELDEGEDGTLYVTAILAGPGVLAQRMGHRRYGSWVQRMHRRTRDQSDDPARIPFSKVAKIGDHIDLAADQEELATQTTHAWVDDHIIRHIPGSGHAAE